MKPLEAELRILELLKDLIEAAPRSVDLFTLRMMARSLIRKGWVRERQE